MPKEDKERDEKNYLALLAIFKRFTSAKSDDEKLSLTEELMAQRANNAIRQAIEGFGMSYDEAIELIQDEGELSDLAVEKRRILSAAIDNLVDFAVAEEYQMLMDLIEESEDEEDDEEEENLKIFKTYNQRYAKIEDSDAEYAMMVAAGLVMVKQTTILTYMTMQDERVRPWHRTYEGFSAPKRSFPAWLIPPIEHQCRCYLIEDDVYDSLEVLAAKKAAPEIPDWFNRTFKESVALGGRIFSDEHPYFQIDKAHNRQLQEIAKRIKSRYFNGTSN